MKAGFDWATALPVLRGVAEADETTLVVGAGTSAESGLPGWATLLDRLLLAAAARLGLKGDDATSFASWTVRADGLAGAGTVAKAVLGDEFIEALRAALYADSGTDPAPGEMSRAVAGLRLAFAGTRSELVTTNYDPLASIAVREGVAALDLPRPPTVSVVTANTPQRRNEVVVRHAHGFLPPHGDPTGTVVLSDADYHLMQDERAWQEPYFRSRLNDTICLFVGSSLTDPNLLRYLWRTGADRGHVAVFARQQHADRYEQLPPRVAAAREQAAARRWESMGVVPLLVDHYAQIAQVVSEITLLRTAGDAYVPFPQRLRTWDRAVRRFALSTTPRAFGARQTRFRELLVEVLRGLGDDLADRGFDLGRRERLHASLWVYRPRENALVNWASSDREWRDPATLEPVPINWSSSFVAVRAFCQGSVVERSTADQAATRWNHVVAAPLTLETAERGRLPVGVLTLASTEPRATSVLHRAMPVLRTTFLPTYLPEIAHLLSP